jgi:gamma-glutamylcyclotransferase (GGCT)/AIG2-like uncharacterized protein YtfP
MLPCRHPSARAFQPVTKMAMPYSDSFLAVYGSLRRRSLAKQCFFVRRNLEFYGYGILRGLLLIQNGYPAVLEQSGQVRVEIFRLEDKAIWEELDRYEGYRPALGSRSLFYRKEVDLLRPEIRAWIYFLGREVPRGRSAAWPQGRRMPRAATRFTLNYDGASASQY